MMDKIEKIGREIREFSPSELAAFRKWFHDFDAEAWDRQLEGDVQAGKLDGLAAAALFLKQCQRDHETLISKRPGAASIFFF